MIVIVNVFMNATYTQCDYKVHGQMLFKMRGGLFSLYI